MALTIGQLATVTREHYRPRLVDQVFRSNPLFERMLKSKKIMIRGGRVIRQPISYAQTSAVTAYEGAEILPTNPNDQLTQAEHNWRQYAATVSIVGKDERLNDGEEELLDLLQTKMDLAKKSLADTLGTDLQGTNSGGKSIDGLGSVLAGSGTYAGIASTDLSDWAASNSTLTVAGTLTLFEIQKLIGNCTDGTDVPTVLLTRQSVFNRVWALLQADQRFAPQEKGSAGFKTLEVSGIDLIVDKHVTGTDGGNQDNWLEALNENYLYMFVHPKANFEVVPIPPLKDQDVKMLRILVMMNLACTKLRVQGAIKTIDPNLG